MKDCTAIYATEMYNKQNASPYQIQMAERTKKICVHQRFDNNGNVVTDLKPLTEPGKEGLAKCNICGQICNLNVNTWVPTLQNTLEVVNGMIVLSPSQGLDGMGVKIELDGRDVLRGVGDIAKVLSTRMIKERSLGDESISNLGVEYEPQRYTTGF